MHLASDQKDLLISQLMAEIFEIEQRDKDYLALRDQLYALQTKYRHLQDEKLLQDNDFKTLYKPSEQVRENRFCIPVHCIVITGSVHLYCNNWFCTNL